MKMFGFIANVFKLRPKLAATIITAVTEVFTAIGDWFVDSISSVSELFYVAETGLTLVGTLSVCGLGIAIVLLLINVIKSFLRFK